MVDWAAHPRLGGARPIHANHLVMISKSPKPQWVPSQARSSISMHRPRSTTMTKMCPCMTHPCSNYQWDQAPYGARSWLGSSQPKLHVVPLLHQPTLEYLSHHLVPHGYHKKITHLLHLTQHRSHCTPPTQPSQPHHFLPISTYATGLLQAWTWFWMHMGQLHSWCPFASYCGDDSHFRDNNNIHVSHGHRDCPSFAMSTIFQKLDTKGF